MQIHLIETRFITKNKTLSPRRVPETFLQRIYIAVFRLLSYNMGQYNKNSYRTSS